MSDDARDAARWRALVGSARIRILGSAGFSRDSASFTSGYRHFGMEVWSIHPAPPSTAGADLLTEYADAVIAHAEKGENNDRS